MKKIYIFALAAMVFAACATDETQDLQPVDVPETLTVGFEENTRIQLNEAQKTVWTKGDLVSVFYRSNANQQWQYQGETGERIGNLKRVSSPVHTTTTSKVVVAYPYSTKYYVNPESGNLQAYLPAKQTYAVNSYGLDGNIMVSSSEYNQFSLKNVCGWIKVQLTGVGKIENITLRGNRGEQVAGEIYIDTNTANSVLASALGGAPEDSDGLTGGTGGNLLFDDTILNAVTLNSPEGVSLTETEPTSFYIALPPQTFAEGISIEIMGTDGAVMHKSTDKEIVIERGCIQPMSAFRYEGTVEIPIGLAYTTNDGYPLDIMTEEGFGAEFVDNMYDENTGRGMLVFNNYVTSIPAEAFLECTNLTWMRLPEGITSIGSEAFFGCTSLEELTIPSTVETIGKSAFVECTGKLTVNCNIANATSNSYGAFYNTAFSDITIGEGVTTIGDYAFGHCIKMENIKLPSTVTTIGKSSFENCNSITSIITPDAIETIDNNAFKDCASLVDVTLGKNLTKLGDYAFSYCKKMANIVIPAKVSYIGTYSFENCDNLTTITIPNSVTTIGDAAFEECDNLTSVTIGKRVQTIGSYSFNRCTKLSSVTIGSSVTTINDYAFCYCSSLTSITIPASVIKIGEGAFEDCSALKAIYCKPTTPPAIYYYRSNSNYNYYYSFPKNSGMKIYVPRASYDSYMQYSSTASGTYPENWYSFESYIVAYDF